MARIDLQDFTLQLDPQRWELMLDKDGLICVCEGPYAIAQNVANAVRLFTKDAYFEQERGIPHYDIELGKKPPYALLRSKIITTALGVEGVADARVTWIEFTNDKVLTGEILLTLKDGSVTNVNF